MKPGDPIRALQPGLNKATEQKQLDPHKVVCVCKHKGKVVGRIAATAPNAEQRMTDLATLYGSLDVEYVEDPMHSPR